MAKAKKKTSVKSKSAKTVKAKRVRARGNIGEQTFAEAQEIVKKEGISLSRAFEKISAKTGRNKQSVAANYYRVARACGAVQARPRRGRPPAGGGSARGALKRAQDALADLARVVAKQEAEIARMQKERSSIEAIRKLVTG